MTDYINNFIFGTIAGSVATFISHPFYNMKNHLQNGNKLDKNHYKNRKWLYNGMLRAMIGYSVEKMIVFGIYNSLKQNDVNSFLAGGISGFIAAFSITPAEQLTIDKQTGIRNFNLNHLYKAVYPTIFRECIGFSVHFTVYDYLTKNFNNERNLLKTSLCGAFAVLIGWGTIIPIDRIKTQIQSGIFDWKKYDFKASYRGTHFALLRAIPFHVTCFLVMETLNKKFKKDKI